MVFYMHDCDRHCDRTSHCWILTGDLDSTDFHLVFSFVFTNKKYNGSTLEIQDSTDFHLAFLVVFTNEKYNGSTLEIQGSDRFMLKQREVSVVSGTGVFRFARGYAILETVKLDLGQLNAVIKFNVTVLHY
ncbi:dirigent protein 11-like [Tasmannia lanceolata]|uniref:dirigent protein 11-like n=1 Tax=Tasmannia lanceolata TaxID=3420 RepID=UPI004063FF27